MAIDSPLAHSQIPNELMECEVTESANINDPTRTLVS